jgi:hypothetical protein
LGVKQVDYHSQRIPINEMIVLLEFSPHAAEQQLIDIRERHPEIALAIGLPIRVNGAGHAKLCADLSTMMQILWLLPANERTSAFRLKCADDVCRQLSGDPTLVVEMERNRKALIATEGIHFHEVDQVGRTSDELAGQATQPMVLDDKRWWAEHEIKLGELAIRKQESEANLVVVRQDAETRRQDAETRRQDADARTVQLLRVMQKDIVATAKCNHAEHLEFLAQNPSMDTPIGRHLGDQYFQRENGMARSVGNKAEYIIENLSLPTNKRTGQQAALTSSDGDVQDAIASSTIRRDVIDISFTAKNMEYSARWIKDNQGRIGTVLAGLYRAKYETDDGPKPQPDWVNGRLLRDVKQYFSEDLDIMQESIKWVNSNPVGTPLPGRKAQKKKRR